LNIAQTLAEGHRDAHFALEIEENIMNNIFYPRGYIKIQKTQLLSTD
jgi:hypothetical protein